MSEHPYINDCSDAKQFFYKCFRSGRGNIPQVRLQSEHNLTHFLSPFTFSLSVRCYLYRLATRSCVINSSCCELEGVLFVCLYFTRSRVPRPKILLRQAWAGLGKYTNSILLFITKGKTSYFKDLLPLFIHHIEIQGN